MFTVLHTSPLWQWSLAGLVWSYLLAGLGAFSSMLLLGYVGNDHIHDGRFDPDASDFGIPLFRVIGRIIGLLAPVPLLLVSDLPIWAVVITAVPLYAGQAWLTYDCLRGAAEHHQYRLSLKRTSIIWLIATNTAICVSILAFAS